MKEEMLQNDNEDIRQENSKESVSNIGAESDVIDLVEDEWHDAGSDGNIPELIPDNLIPVLKIALPIAGAALLILILIIAGLRGANDRDKKEQSAKTKNRNKTKAEKVNMAPERGMVRTAIKDIPSEQAPEKIIFTKHPTRPDASVEKVLQNTISDVRIRSQEYQHQYGTDSVFWIKQKPLYENRQYAQFLLPDGKNSIIIRQADILPGRDAQTGMRLAAVFTDQRYSMMNMEKVNVVAADGSKAIAMFKLPGGAVIAHGNQQPDKKKGGPELAKGTQKKEQTTGNKTVRSPEKTKSR